MTIDRGKGFAAVNLWFQGVALLNQLTQLALKPLQRDPVVNFVVRFLSSFREAVENAISKDES